MSLLLPMNSPLKKAGSVYLERFLLLTILLVTTVSKPTIVHAEKADRDKPLEIEADTVTSNEAKKITIYSGNVIVTQGTLIIKGDKLVVREDESGFQHGSSYGNPTTFKQKRDGKNEYMEGGAMRIEYDGRMDKVQLFTKAWVKRGEDTVHGDYIMYDGTAEYSEVIGGGGKSPNSDGRVKAVIQPKNKSPEKIDFN
jgi:lipopolysaccharide export system protein LptA